MAMPNPQPTKRGQGWNSRPHWCQSDSLTTEPRQELQIVHFLFTPFLELTCTNICFLKEYILRKKPTKRSRGKEHTGRKGVNTLTFKLFAALFFIVIILNE